MIYPEGQKKNGTDKKKTRFSFQDSSSRWRVVWTKKKRTPSPCGLGFKQNLPKKMWKKIEKKNYFFEKNGIFFWFFPKKFFWCWRFDVFRKSVHFHKNPYTNFKSLYRTLEWSCGSTNITYLERAREKLNFCTGNHLHMINILQKTQKWQNWNFNCTQKAQNQFFLKKNWPIKIVWRKYSPQDFSWNHLKSC